ncbi:MAG: DNA-binding transcriptional LysR family regulator [Cellvibrionaceae bacterium]|jgi:DNA-binding transcriptional LysR family regulator
MNFKRIEAFFWVSKLSSFSKAAEQQCTTQPAISSRIAVLEEELGVKLFQREGNSKVFLTPKGHELMPYAEKLVYFAKEFTNAANNAAAYSGLLRLGVSETIAHSWLSFFLKRFQENVPGVAIELTVDVSVTLAKQLTSGTIDIAFLVGPLSDPVIVNEHLETVPLIWVASPKLKIGSDYKPLSFLSQWPIITYARNTTPYNEITREFAKCSERPARLFASSSLAVCRQLVIDGMGVSALPVDVIKPNLDNGSMHIINTHWHPSSLTFTASYPMTPHKPELLSMIALVQAVIEEHVV